MKISFHGAAQTVTGSQYLLQINGKRLLLECGLFQGKRQDTYERNRFFPFDARKVDAVILSHAHIDHSGNLPQLASDGYSGPIYATPATCKLCELMLMDSAHIQEADIEFLNKKRARRGEKALEPLYTVADASQVMPLLSPVEYDTPFEPVPGVTARLVDAGHILGSAAVVLDIEEHGRKFRLWFSGDIGRLKLPLLKDPVLPEKVDYLMMECTYGDKPHRDPEDAVEEFGQVVRRTVKRGGKVIVPAFAVGRTQELVYELNRLFSSGRVPRVPVYVDSPLAVNVSKVFQQFPQYYDDETRQFVSAGRHPALNYDGLTYIGSVEESKALNDRDEPMVILSASGMAETGRILHHLRNNIEDPRNTVVIVSWQAPDTLGRRLAERERWIKIFGDTYERRADVATIGGLSAHAGQDFLLQYAASSAAGLRRLFLVHGEPAAAGALQERLSAFNIGPVTYPEFAQEVEI